MKELLLIAALLATFLTSVAQSTTSNHDLLEVRKKGVYAHHADSYVANILTGRRFVAYSSQFKQFFQGKYTTLGTLIYDGVLFEDIDIQYNVFTQEVVVLLETELIERYIMVTPDKVSRFSVYGHEFVQLPGDSVMAKGIYELAYGGVNSNVYIKHSSIKKEMIDEGKINYEYEPIRKFYVTNEFGAFRITSKKKLLEAYQDSQKLAAILKKHKIKFSKKKIEQDLVRAISLLETANGVADL
jgi:hypothetical protein